MNYQYINTKRSRSKLTDKGKEAQKSQIATDKDRAERWNEHQRLCNCPFIVTQEVSNALRRPIVPTKILAIYSPTPEVFVMTPEDILHDLQYHEQTLLQKVS